MSSATDCDGKHFETWAEMRDFLFDSHIEGVIWRGAGNAQWCITTSLDRFANDNFVTDRSALAARLQRLYRQYSFELGEDTSELSDADLWAVGQHWGLPTPLLDWTQSPMVAAYFAFTALSAGADIGDRNCVVYRLDSNRPFLNRQGDVSITAPPPGPWNERLTAQRGVFTTGRLQTCLIEQLQAMQESDALTAYTIPGSESRKALTDLDAMMISDRRIFPDKIGVLREVRTQAIHGLASND